MAQNLRRIEAAVFGLLLLAPLSGRAQDAATPEPFGGTLLQNAMRDQPVAPAPSGVLAECQEGDDIVQDQSDAFANLNATQGVGQSFIAPCAGRLRTVIVHVTSVEEGPITGTLRVFRGAGGTGQQIAAASYSLFGTGLNYINLSEQGAYVILQEGQVYTFLLDAPSSGAGNISGLNGNPYTGGNLYAGPDPSNLAGFGADMRFRLDIAPITCTVDDYVPDEVCLLLGDINALVALYNSTNGAGWTTTTNWFTSDIASWHGVTLAGSRVTGLNLDDNNLTGVISPAIGDLGALATLSAKVNNLTGSIPTEIGNLTNLTSVELSGNQLTGSLPSSIGNLTNVTFFSIYGNLVTGSIPSTIGGMSSLVLLQLGLNAFTGELPSEIGNLSSLQYLYLGDNLTLGGELPPEIGNLSALRQLEFYKTALSGLLPASLTNLSQLERLWFQTTSVCEPVDNAFQAWIGGVASVQRSGYVCAPMLDITPASLAFGDVAVGESKDLVLTVDNVGVLDTDLTVSGLGSGGFSFVSGSGSTVLTPGTQQEVVVRFAPAANGAANSSVSLAAEAFGIGQNADVEATGNGLSGQIAVSPASVDFGDVVVGESNDVSVTITNNGNATLSGSVAGGSGFAAAGYAIESGSGSFALEIGQSKEIVVRLTPGSTGTKSSTLAITHNGTNTSSPLAVSLTGEGIEGAATIAVSPTALSFGTVTVGASVERSFTVRHSGSQGRLIGSVSDFGDFADKGFAYVAGGGGFDLGPGEEVQVTVSFTPATAGEVSAQLKVNHNATNAEPDILVSLTATAVDAEVPVFEITPSSLSFGEVAVGQAAELALTVANRGEGTLSGEVSLPAGLVANGFSLASGAGAYSLTPDQTWVVIVQFAPEAEGEAAGSVQITHDAQDPESPVTVALSGTGTAEAVELTAATDEVSVTVVCTTAGTCAAPEPVVIAVLENDTPATGGTLQLLGVVSFPAKGLAEANGDGTITYTPFAESADGADTFQYQVSDGSSTAVGTVNITFVVTTSSASDVVPGRFVLDQNYPNPFNPSTVIRYGLDEAGPVRLRVFAPNGQLVRTLVDRIQQPGLYDVTFDARDLPSGSYLYVLEQGESTTTRVLTLSR